MKYKIIVEYETTRFKNRTTFVGSISDIEKVVKEECKILGENSFKIKKFKARNIK